MRCTVQLCTTTQADLWERDVIGRPFCPNHPVATACRKCGRDKGSNRVLCRPCALGNTPPLQAPPWRWTGTLGITGAGPTRSVEIDAQQEGGQDITLELPVDQARQLHAQLGHLLAAEDMPPLGGTVCEAYVPPTGQPADCGLCARCGMYDWRHQAPAAVDPMEDINDWADTPHPIASRP